MKKEREILALLEMSSKELEAVLGLKIRNGQGRSAIRKTILWVLE